MALTPEIKELKGDLLIKKFKDFIKTKVNELGSLSAGELAEECGYTKDRINNFKAEINTQLFLVAQKHEKIDGEKIVNALTKNEKIILFYAKSSKSIDPLAYYLAIIIAAYNGYIENKRGRKLFPIDLLFKELSKGGLLKSLYRDINGTNPNEVTEKDINDLIKSYVKNKTTNEKDRNIKDNRNKNNESNKNINKKSDLDFKKLIETCLEMYKNGEEETTICIRCGFNTDDIGSFRRAFAKGTGVNLAPLNKMVKEYRVKENGKDILEADELFIDRMVKASSIKRKVRSSSFRDRILNFHGPTCVCCSISIPSLIEAAHIIPVEDNGNDDITNGIPLCPTHHKAFDLLLFTFDPLNKSIILRKKLKNHDLSITKKTVELNISIEAVQHRYMLFNQLNRDNE